MRSGCRRSFVTALVALACLMTACRSDAAPPSPSPSSTAREGLVDIGGYSLWYACSGTGSPTVILDAGLGAAGSSEWTELIPALAPLGTTVCTYDRAGNGLSDARPDGPAPTAETAADELEALLLAAAVEPPYVIVSHSYGGLVARVFIDRYPDQVAGAVFEDVSTAWEIDLWPRWDPSPWIDGGVKTDIQETERQVLLAEPLGDRPTIVVSQTAYDEEGIPPWAGPIFAKQQDKLAAMADDVIHVRIRNTGHFIHREHLEVMVEAIAAVLRAVRSNGGLASCASAFTDRSVECVG